MTAETWWIDALLAPEGQALLDAFSREAIVPDTELAIITRYRAQYAPGLVAAALNQVKLRVSARAKFTRADRMFFTKAGLEQASSERMAHHHARRYEPYGTLADLCSGIGGDLIGLAADRAVIAIDKDPVHARLSAINAEMNPILGSVVSGCADVRDAPLHIFDALFIDPARRTEDRRLRPGLSEPPLEWCLGLATQKPIGIKAAPGLPAELVPAGWERELVSDGREMKETMLWSPQLATTKRRATLLPAGLTLTERDGASLPVNTPGAFLLDPDPAVTRAGLVEELGESLGDAWKIDEQVGFLSSDTELRTPFARTLRIEASLPFNLKRLREQLGSLDIGSVDIRKRGSAVDVDELQRKLKLRGTRAATVVLTRVADRPWAFVCT